MSFKDKLLWKAITFLDRISGWLEDRLDADDWMDFKVGGTE
jgi:hypothetical protein